MRQPLGRSHAIVYMTHDIINECMLAAKYAEKYVRETADAAERNTVQRSLHSVLPPVTSHRSLREAAILQRNGNED